MFIVNNRSTLRCSGVFIVNFEDSWPVSSVFCWVWTCKSWMEYLIALIRVGSRRPVTFKTKLSVLTYNNSFQLLPIFWYKELHIRCFIGFELNIVTWFMKTLKGIRGYSPWSSATLGKYENLIFLDTLKIHF